MMFVIIQAWQLFRDAMKAIAAPATNFDTVTVATRNSEEKKAIRYRPPSYQLHLMNILCVITNEQHLLSHDDC